MKLKTCTVKFYICVDRSGHHYLLEDYGNIRWFCFEDGMITRERESIRGLVKASKLTILDSWHEKTIKRKF